MPRQNYDEDLDEEDDVDELDDSERIARMEAENEALVEAHAGESSLPWYAFDVLFRPRLAALRWTEDSDDRLRDRAVAIVAFWTIGHALAILAANVGVRWSLGHWLGLALLMFAMFLVGCVFLAGSAKVYDAIGRGLGAQENFARIRVVLAMTLIPPMFVGFPLHILILIFGGREEIPHDHELAPDGLRWAFLAVYGVWLTLFPIGALRAVQLFPWGKAIGNHLMGMLCTVLFWIVVGFGVYFIFKLNSWVIDLGSFRVF